MRPLFSLSPEKRRKLRGSLRVLTYCGVVGLVFGAIQLREARAELRSRTVELGREMMKLAHPTEHDVNRITMNGQAIYIASSITKDSVDAVLDRYEGYCSSSSAQPPSEWKALAGKEGQKADEPSMLATGTLRGGDDNEGTVVCFTKNAHSKPSLKEAVRAFSETGDLGALGSMRYVYAKPTNSGRTHVLTAWTDDKFMLGDLVPKEGVDSPGRDFEGLPRQPNSQRTLSARIDGTPYGVNVYLSADSPEKIVGYYDHEMLERGWFALDPELQNTGEEFDPKNPPIARLYEKDGVVLTVASRFEGDGVSATMLGLAGLSADPKTAAAGSFMSR